MTWTGLMLFLIVALLFSIESALRDIARHTANLNKEKK